jgi:hypothetical protein
MEPTKAKSNQRILSFILILLSIPILYPIGKRIFYHPVESPEESFFNVSNIWFVIQNIIYVVLLVLLALRKYGMLLVYLGIYFVKCFRFWFYFTNYLNGHSWEFWIFNTINFLCLALILILLKREDDRYFNLKFSSKITGYEKTNRLIMVFCITYLVLQSIEIYYALQYYAYMGRTFYAEIILFAVSVVFVIIGIVTKTRIINLAFVFVLANLLNMFLANGSILLVPFSENWGDQFQFLYIIIGVVYNTAFLAFGVILYFIIRIYLKEKSLNEGINLSDSDTLDI